MSTNDVAFWLERGVTVYTFVLHEYDFPSVRKFPVASTICSCSLQLIELSSAPDIRVPSSAIVLVRVAILRGNYHK